MRCTLVGTRPRIVKELPTSQTLFRPPAKPLGTLCPPYKPNALCRAVKITKVHKWVSALPGRKVMERSTPAIRRDRSWPITLRTSRRITESGVSSRSLWHCCARQVWNTIRDTCLDDSCSVQKTDASLEHQAANMRSAARRNSEHGTSRTFQPRLRNVNCVGDSAHRLRFPGHRDPVRYLVGCGCGYRLADRLQRRISVHPCLPVERRRAHTLEAFGRGSVSDRRLLFSAASRAGSCRIHSGAGNFLCGGGSVRPGGLLPSPRYPGIGLDSVRRHRHLDPRRAGLAAVALQLDVGDRYAGRNQHDLHRDDASDAEPGCKASGAQLTRAQCRSLAPEVCCSVGPTRITLGRSLRPVPALPVKRSTFRHYALRGNDVVTSSRSGRTEIVSSKCSVGRAESSSPR